MQAVLVILVYELQRVHKARQLVRTLCESLHIQQLAHRFAHLSSRDQSRVRIHLCSFVSHCKSKQSAQHSIAVRSVVYLLLKQRVVVHALSL